MAWMMTLDQLQQGTGGRILTQHATSFSGVGTDTRVDLKGKIFFALKGDRFDAHEFLDKALDQGASAIVAQRWPIAAVERLKTQATLIEVDDTLRAFQDLSRLWRHQQKARILGLTGTNGKTTTKEFSATILGERFNTACSKGSLNNHWGVPMSLFAIEPHHEVAVIEMGMNRRGEIHDLVRIADPDVVAVTMVGRGHLEGLGTVEEVAKAKEEIYAATQPAATRIFNLDNPFTQKMHRRALAGDYGTGRILTFSSGSTVVAPGENSSLTDVSMALESAGEDSLSLRGSIAGVEGIARVPVFGAHNVNNLMVAACFGVAVGMSPEEIWKSLPKCQTGWGRNQWVRLASGGKVLFDAYNANPESMKVALQNFAGLSVGHKGRKIGILSEMLEVGPQGESLHRELGEQAARAGFDALYFVGPSEAAFADGVKCSGFKNSLYISNSYEDFLASGQSPVINPSDIVLMKGSRGMQLERILKSWEPLDFQMKK